MSELGAVVVALTDVLEALVVEVAELLVAELLVEGEEACCPDEPPQAPIAPAASTVASVVIRCRPLISRMVYKPSLDASIEFAGALNVTGWLNSSNVTAPALAPTFWISTGYGCPVVATNSVPPLLESRTATTF